MNVTLCSAFRDSSAYIGRYFEQIASLRAALEMRGDCLGLVLGEGDSVDDSGEALYAAIVEGRYETTLLDVTHGGPYHGSVAHPERFRQLAYIWNEIWSAIQHNADAVLFVESDLIWDAPTLVALIDHLAVVPAIAPMVMLERKGYPANCFYDVWSFRKNGQHFNPLPPYDAWLDSDLMQLDSAGSCIAMRGDLARQLHWPDEDVVVGVCRQIYELGGSVWLDPALKIIHR